MKKRLLFIVLLLLFVGGFLLPEGRVMPVLGATSADWHPRSFWYYPWGRSGTHKGIDIFAGHGTLVLASGGGLVVRSGVDSRGGNVVLVLGSKWRLHYYAHLQSIAVSTGQWVGAGEAIGTVGDSGNAKGKPPHLHYTIRSLAPLPWNADPAAPQGWRKMFYVDPGAFLLG